MANNTAEFTLLLNAVGDLTKATKQLAGFGNEHKKAGKAVRDSAAAQAEHDYKLSQGIRGTAAAGRSMSKLTQTIGSGPNGLVGAYATLAANAFAVSASFEALRSGAQVIQIMKGLELQGAKTGRALTLTAEGIERITMGSLSGADAMRAAALGTSAGLNRKDLEELTQVATNASLVLGRNIPDSMDRIIKGVTKLEPELLDELGLMTKLTEASEKYARANGKSATSLTNMEKRLAFVEAIKAEGTLKYDGVADELGANRLDELGAAFKNLVNDLTGGITAASTTSAVISTLTDSTYGLYGALLLLGSYVAKQYTGGLRQMSLQTLEVSKALDQKARALKETTKAQMGQTKAVMEGAKADSIAAAALNRRQSGKALVTQQAAIGGDRASQEAWIKSRENSNKRFEKELLKLKDVETDVAEKRRNSIQQSIQANNLEIESTKAAIKAQDAYASARARTSQNDIRMRAAQQGSLAQGRAALAMEAAASLKVGQAYKNVLDSTRNYHKQLILNAQASAVASANAINNGKSVTFLSSALNLVGPAALKARVGIYALTLGIKTVGIAFATLLPWIGVITIAFSMAQAAYENFFRSEDSKKKEKALKDLQTVTESTIKSAKEFQKVQQSTNLTLGDKTLKALTIQTNAMVELTQAYLDFVDASDKAANSASDTLGTIEFLSKASASEIGKAFSPITAYNTVIKGLYSSYVNESPFLDKSTLKKQMGLVTDVAAEASMKMVSTWDKGISLLIGGDGISEQNKEISKTIDSIAIYDKALAESIKISSDIDETQNNVAKALAKAQPFWTRAQLAVQNFTDSVKTAETAQLDFIKSISVTTKFDNALSAFSSLSSSITELEKVLGSESFRGNSLGKLLSGLGPAVTGVLSPEAQSALKSVKEDYSQVNTLNKELYDLQLKGITTGKTVEQLTTARDKLESGIKTTLESQTKNIVSGIKAYEDRLKTAQLESITLQGSLVLQQASLEVLQRKGVIVAADLKKQIDAQNAIKEVQAKILEIDLQFLEQKIQQQQLELGNIEIKLKAIEAGNAELDISDRLTENSLIQQKANLESIRNLAAAKEIQTQIAGITIYSSNNQAYDPEKARKYEEQISAVEERLKKIQDPKERKTSLETTRDEIKSAIALSEAQISAARAQVKAIRDTKIGGTERDLMGQEITIKNASEVQAKTLAIGEINSENLRINEKINNVLSNRVSSINEEVRALREQSIERQDSLAAQAAASIAELMRQKDLAKGNDKAQQELQTRINLAEEEYKASVKLEQSRTRLEIIQKTLNISIEDGIKAQQDALNILQKQADLSNQIVSANIEIARAQARIAAKRMGGEVDPITEFMLNKKAAEAEYQVALQNYKLRILGIDSEYDLLEAQRIAQAASLKASAMLLEATLKANGGVSAAQQATIDSVNNAADIMESRNYDISRQQAKEVERLGLERLRLAKEEASIFSTGSGSAVATAMANIGSIFTKIATPEPIDTDGIKIISPDMTALKESAKSQLSSAEILVKEIQKANFSGIALDVKFIAQKLRQSEDSSAAANIIPNATSAQSASNVQSSLVTRLGTVGDKFKARGGKHKGIDIEMDQGTEVPATIAGRLSFNKHAEGGYQAFIKGENGVRVGYAHLSEQYKALEGTIVRVGDIIGKSGGAVGTKGAGNSTGAHLHYTVTVNGEKVDPLKPIPIQLTTRAVSTARAEQTSYGPLDTHKNRMVEDNKPIAAASSSLVANDNEVTDLGDIIDKKTIPALNRLALAQLPVKLGIKEYGLIAASVFGAINLDLEKMKSGLDTVGQARMDVVIGISNMMASIGTIVPQTMEILTTTFDEFKAQQEKMGKVVDVNVTQSMYKAQQMSAAFAAAAQVIAGVSAILQAQSNAKIATIDKEIAAEEKRDGKSAASVAKLDQLEKKKDSMARKAFNTNKKLMMAQAVMSTAAGVTNALAAPTGNPLLNAIMAGMIGAMGMAQVAIIAGTSYESSYTPKAVTTPSNLSIGKRGDTVDLARGPNASAGGEVGYLRGSSGTGSNASNYRTVGSAYGGELMRGYGNRGFVVGEKGPEVITPETPISVTPANDVGMAQPINANFTIQALDSHGVQDILVSQKGNIIKMLREAANASGKTFMEDVNVNVYTRPSVGKL